MSEPFEDETPETDDDAVERHTTGHPRIDEALSRLDGLDDLEITQHPEEFDAIHRVLRESLASAGRDGDPPDAP
ncbi:MAG: hypothetical protein JWQ70_1887 [Aeromicrobium sp.]|jgi:hypothetical protein|nr:hypothetical protein [Aeromicrobium sp.]